MNARTGMLTIGVLATISALAASCGGGGAKPLTEDDFCTQKAAKECIKVADSCTVVVTDCQTARKKVCLDTNAAIKGVAGTPRVFHPENVPACISKTAAVYAQTSIKPQDLADVDDVCQYVFQGNVAKLAECTVKYDCKDRGATICDKGHCADKVVKGANLQCSDFGAVCSPSQYCTMMGAAMQCVDKKGTGVACDANTPCQDILRCVGGVCAARLMASAKCCNDNDCPTAAPYCNPYAGYECGSGLTFAAHSPSCTAFGDSEATPPAGTPTCTATGAAGSGGGGAGGAAGGGAGAGGAAGGGAGAGGAAGGSDAGSDTGVTADHE